LPLTATAANAAKGSEKNWRTIATALQLRLLLLLPSFGALGARWASIADRAAALLLAESAPEIAAAAPRLRLFRGEEDLLATHQIIADAGRSAGGKLLQRKPVRADPVAEIRAAIVTDMIILSEMQVAFGLRSDVGIFVALRLSLDDRHHDHDLSSGPKNAAHLGQGKPVVDMFEHMRADDPIEARILKIDPLYIQRPIGAFGLMSAVR
jgi:hypothetical protein